MIGPKPDNQPGPAFRWCARIYYEDTDAAGVAYHTAYLRFIERARTEWLRALGFKQSSLREELGVAFAVRSLQIDYKRPAALDDQLLIVTRVSPHRRTALHFAQHIHRVSGDGALLCRACVEVACMDARTHRPRGIPRAIAAELEDVG